MNTLQTQYPTLKRLHDKAQKKALKDMKPHASLLDSGTDADIEQYVELEMAAEQKYGVMTLWNAMMDTENALLDWFKIAMLRESPKDEETINLTVDEGRHHLKHREMLIDMALRLA